MINDFLEQQFDQAHRLEEMALYHLKTGGKRLRGRLSLAEAHELKVDSDKALLWAASCELLHNATLIHDDIQDNDPIRRGLPSLWKKYGLAQAINAGDFLIFKAFRLASQIEQPLLVQLLSQTAETLVQGQCEELSPCKQKPYWNSYLRIARLKTGVLFQLPIEGIHLIKSQHLMDSFNYAREWSQLGVIYQIFDDINDFLGLKQQGQKQKDFLEKRLNSIIAYLSQDPMHGPLIQEYLDCEVESSEQKEIIEQLNIIILQEDILSQLKKYCQELLTQFQSSSQTQAKEIILGEMQKTIKKGNLHHENASL